MDDITVRYLKELRAAVSSFYQNINVKLTEYENKTFDNLDNAELIMNLNNMIRYCEKFDGAENVDINYGLAKLIRQKTDDSDFYIKLLNTLYDAPKNSNQHDSDYIISENGLKNTIRVFIDTYRLFNNLLEEMVIHGEFNDTNTFSIDRIMNLRKDIEYGIVYLKKIHRENCLVSEPDQNG